MALGRIKVFAKVILCAISPKLQASVRYKYATGEKLNWKEPQDFNAKINYLKIYKYYKNETVTKCVDKYRIREYLEQKGLSNIAPVLYGVYDRPDELEWDKYPAQFAVKCNHASGTNIIVQDKTKLDIDDAVKKLKKWMKYNLWKEGELQYKYVKKKIIVEEYLGDGDVLETYKFYCFNGVPKVLYLSMDEDKYLSFYDMDYKRLPINKLEHLPIVGHDEKPKHWNEMLDIAKKLSEDFPFVRVDLYDTPKQVYISELTFVPTGGNMKLDNNERLKEWGSWIELEN